MAKKGKKVGGKDDESAMAEISRKFKASPGLYIGSVLILVLVVIAFVGGDIMSGGGCSRGGDWTFGSYDRVSISYERNSILGQHYDQLVREHRDFINLDDIWTLHMVWQEAFNRAAVQTAVIQEIKRSNYTIPASIVDRRLVQLPMFQENGRFSATLFNQMDDRRRDILWNQIRDQLIMDRYYNDLFELPVPSAEKEFIANQGKIWYDSD